MTALKSGMSIGKYLDDVISETVKQNLYNKALEEKEKQVSFSSKNSGGDQATDSSGEEDTADFDAMKDSNDSSDDSEALKGNVKLDDVIEKLNTIRSGKSFKDSLVTQRFEEYFGSLKDAEKVAMFAFLKGIAQIVTGEVEPEQATEPSDKPADVQMKKGPDVQTKNIKPNVIKKPTPSVDSKPAPKSGGEDTSAPIQVKKRQ